MLIRRASSFGIPATANPVQNPTRVGYKSLEECKRGTTSSGVRYMPGGRSSPLCLWRESTRRRRGRASRQRRPRDVATACDGCCGNRAETSISTMTSSPSQSKPRSGPPDAKANRCQGYSDTLTRLRLSSSGPDCQAAVALRTATTPESAAHPRVRRRSRPARQAQAISSPCQRGDRGQATLVWAAWVVSGDSMTDRDGRPTASASVDAT